MIHKASTFKLGSHTVKRLGYGAMQSAGPGVFGPPKDRDTALAVLRKAVASGVNHIDTSDFYGPYVTNRLIREALAPYPDDLTIVTKIGARRGEDGSWIPAFDLDELARAVDGNLRNLGRRNVKQALAGAPAGQVIASTNDVAKQLAVACPFRVIAGTWQSTSDC